MEKRRKRRRRREPEARGPQTRGLLLGFGAIALVGLVAVYSLVLSGGGQEAQPQRAGTAVPTADLPAFMDRLCSRSPEDPAWSTTRAFCSMEPARLRLANDAGKEVEIPVLLATRLEQWYAGYQFIGERVIGQTAILFVYPREIGGGMHMCNVAAPLDVAWFRADGTVLDIQRALPGPRQDPASCPNVYTPKQPGRYRYALETPAGALEAFGVTGDKARLIGVI